MGSNDQKVEKMEKKVGRISSVENGEMEKNNGENEKVEKKVEKWGKLVKIGNFRVEKKKWRKFAIKVEKKSYTIHGAEGSMP